MSERPPPRFLTSLEVAAACGVSTRTVSNWMRDGSIPAHRTVGGHGRVAVADLRKFLEARGMPVPATLLDPAGPGPGPTAEPRKRILVIDDDEPFLEVVREFLTSSGFDVETARHGFLAGYLAGHRRPDAILLDLVMPGLDGFEVLALMRRQADARSIPVVAVTSLKGPEIEAKVRAAGFHSYVRKPVDFRALLGLLAAATR